MIKIEQVGVEPLQKHSIIIDDGTSFSIQIYFSPMQKGWYITKLQYGDFILEGVRIVNSYNILHQYRNQIPFGIVCLSESNREPMLQEDFYSGASKLYLIDRSEVDQYDRYLRG